MNDVLSVMLFLPLGILLVTQLRRFFPKHLHRWIAAGFAFHIVAAFMQVIITQYIYGGGDLFAYFILGGRFTELLSIDFFEYFPQLVDVMNGNRNSLGVFGDGTSTGGMIALSAVVLFFTFKSLYGACLVLSIWAFLGQLAILWVMRQNLPDELDRRLAIAALMMPSVVFWSSGLLKEAPAMGALGLLLLGAHWIVWGKRYVGGAILLVVSSYIIGITKSYLLFAFFIAAGVWLFWHRSSFAERAAAILTRPFYLAVGAVIVIGALAGLSVLFPRFAPANLAAEAAQLQSLYSQQGGGSTYALGDPNDTSVAGQLANAPLGMASALLRPFFFEVHNATSLINAVEMFFVLLIWIQIIRTRGLRLLRPILRSPFLVFCLAFVLPFSLAVGIAAPNLGSLSRYRIPMMPFYLCLLACLLPWTRWERRRRATGA